MKIEILMDCFSLFKILDTLLDIDWGGDDGNSWLQVPPDSLQFQVEDDDIWKDTTFDDQMYDHHDAYVQPPTVSATSTTGNATAGTIGGTVLRSQQLPAQVQAPSEVHVRQYLPQREFQSHASSRAHQVTRGVHPQQDGTYGTGKPTVRCCGD